MFATRFVFSVIPLRSEVLAIIFAVGSTELPVFCNSILAPIWRRACKNPILEGFIPTFLINISESGVMSPASIKKDADEKSPQIFIS